MSKFTPNPHVDEYINKVKQKAEASVRELFPQKILTLNALLDSADFNVKDVNSLHQPLNIPIPEPISATTRGRKHGDPAAKRPKLDHDVNGEIDDPPILTAEGTRVYALTSGPVESNLKIIRLIDLVKPHIRQLVEDSNLLKMWITFLIPKIEDGNNFGVSIQEDTLGEIRTVEAEVAAYYEQISRYFITRGKIISKVAKYPHVNDYRKLIAELDEKEFLSLRIVLSEVRNHYATLYDLISKNMEKIIKPRTSNTENLY